jgi:uncharacterized protein YhaN
MMIIKDVYLKNFGSYRDADFYFNNGFNLLYGFNEAGKSTLLAFIRYCLFGLPPKKRGVQENMYEPTSGNGYGGYIHIEKENKIYRVERNFNSKLSLTIYDADRNQMLSDELERFAPNNTRSVFENVFAFGLDELRDSELFNDDSIKDFIYSSSIGIDIDEVRRVQNELNTDCDQLFKSSGAYTRIINSLVKEYESLKAEIQKKQRELVTYQDYKLEQASYKTGLDTIAEDLKENQKSLNLYEEYKNTYREVQNYLEYNQKLQIFSDLPEFELSLMEEYKQLKNNKSNLECFIRDIEIEISSIQDELSKLIYNENLLNKVDAYNELLGLKTSVENASNKLPLLDSKILEYQLELKSIQKGLGEGWNYDNISSLQFNIETDDRMLRMKNDLYNMNSEIQKYENDLKNYNMTEADKKNEKETIQNKLAGLPLQTKEEIKSKSLLLEKLKKLSDRYIQATEKQAEQQQVPLLQQIMKKFGYIRTAMVTVTILLFFITIGFAFIAGADILLALAFGIILAAILGILTLLFQMQINAVHITSKSGENIESLDELKKEIVEIMQQITGNQSFKKFDRYDMVNIINQYQQAIIDCANLLTELDNKEREIDSLNNIIQGLSGNLQAKKNDYATALVAWQEWLTSLHLNPDYTLETMERIVDHVNKAQKTMLNMNHAQNEKTEQETLQTNADSRLTNFIKETNLFLNSTSFSDAMDEIHREVQSQQAIFRQYEICQNLLSKKANELQQHQGKLNSYLESLNEIFKKAGVISEEQLIELAEKIETKNDLMADCRTYFQNISSVARRCHLDPEQLIAHIQELSEDEIISEGEKYTAKIEAFEEERATLNQKIGEVESEIKALESGDGLSDLISRKEALKLKINELAQNWIKSKMFVSVIDKAKKEYEKEHQPGVIKQANAIFNTITGGRYTRIIKSFETDDLTVEQGREIMPILNLSQGTLEQLYLALRLGYIKNYAENHHKYPLVFDDVFVNFDPDRTRHALQTLIDLASEYQIFFMTCHPEIKYILDSFGKEYNYIELQNRQKMATV